MTTRIAINGFGRIGRLALRRIQTLNDIDVVAINDLVPGDYLAYLLKYDTMQGTFPYSVEETEGGLVINGEKVNLYAERDAANLPWKELKVDLVLECTGFYTTKEKAEAHIQAGAKAVLISAPAKGDGVKTIVYNVNHDILDGTETVVSGASCTTNCLAPMVNALNKEFGIEMAQMSTVHAYTATQSIQDGPKGGKDFRNGRAAALNTIPQATGAAKAIGKVIPELNGRIDGSALRVPIGTGSITELYSTLNKKVTVEKVNAAMKKYETESFLYNTDAIVSSDIVGTTAGSVFDATLTKIVEFGDKQLVKTCAWYDNEYGYVCQLVRTMQHFAELLK
ncbi:MAG: type I glyceraldehyde-3-phosphate dehydrogenase [Peptoniphilaceae bacterium]|nr:type I glyceraldehyde-3-phosphate dehydrogenase [Peptoniphilaceae bacterium]